jgi:hypothetical protein
MNKRRVFSTALLLVLSAPALTDPLSSTTKVAPTLFEFAHPSGGLIYERDPLTGAPARLGYWDRYRVFETDSEGIRVLETELGQQISVDLLQIPDLRTTTLTLVLPRVNLSVNVSLAPEPDASPEMVTAYAIVAIHRTSIAGPDILSGQIDLHAFTPLLGKAQFGSPAAPAETSTGVIGRVFVAPTCPVVTKGQPPCIAPFAGARVWLTEETQGLVYETVADNRGLFAIEAPVGNYVLHAAGDGRLPSCPEEAITITEDQAQIFFWAEARQHAVLNCDTGIR